jgi:hypothetical protein
MLLCFTFTKYSLAEMVHRLIKIFAVIRFPPKWCQLSHWNDSPFGRCPPAPSAGSVVFHGLRLAIHGETANRRDNVAIVNLLRTAGFQVDAGNAQLGKGFKLTSLADTILVQITPDPQLTENGIFGVNNTVFVGVK